VREYVSRSVWTGIVLSRDWPHAQVLEGADAPPRLAGAMPEREPRLLFLRTLVDGLARRLVVQDKADFDDLADARGLDDLL